MTSTPTPEPAKITCPDCGGHPSEPKLRTEGGSLSCSFCNRTLTFNFMRDNEPEHRACACRASRNARCQTCGGDGEIDVRPAPSTPGEGAGRPDTAKRLAPTPFETWSAGMFTGSVLAAQGRPVRSFSEDEIRSEFTSWLEEWVHESGHFGTPPASPEQGTGRPDTAQLREAATNAEVGGIVDETIITAAADWIDAQPPASPADDVPDADAVAFQNGYQIGVRVGSEHHGPCRGLPPASPVPPTPTPCPYIVTGGEGTSHCSLAERSAPVERPQPDEQR